MWYQFDVAGVNQVTSNTQEGGELCSLENDLK